MGKHIMLIHIFVCASLFGVLYASQIKSGCFYQGQLLTRTMGTCGEDNVCSCYEDDYGDLIADCGGSNLHEVPGKLPINTSYIYIHETKIREIPSDAFVGTPKLLKLALTDSDIEILHSTSFRGIPDLYCLSLVNNTLKTFPGNVFEGLSSLNFLYLGDNNLQTLPENTFKRVPLLQILDVSDNDIQQLSVGLFSQISSLDHLCLSNNKIEVLQRKHFEGLSNMSSLDLNTNKLRTLTENMFEDLRSLRHLLLQKNNLETIQDHSFRGLSRLQLLDLSKNRLQSLPTNIFADLSSLQDLDLTYNELKVMHKSCFEGLLSLEILRLQTNKIKLLDKGNFGGLPKLIILELSGNKLQTLPTKLFADISTLEVLYLDNNSITSLPNDCFYGLSNLTKLKLNINELQSIPAQLFRGLNHLKKLFLNNNKIRFLHVGSFEGLSSLDFLDLADNNISELVPGLFNQTVGYTLTTLFLQKNNLKVIHREAFFGLNKLQFLCLYSNHIDTIEDNAFSLAELQYIYMFQNDLTNITGNPFESKVLKQLHIYLNKISQIEDRSLMGIPYKTTVYLSCDFLLVLPKNSKHDKIKCASASTAPSISAGGSLDIGVALGKDGFNCTLYDYDFDCSPCGIGTYGDTITGGCHSCPIGGFYEDQIAQTMTSHNGQIPCKLCNEGTYVKEGQGTSAKDCEVCPEGTRQDIHAGFRACSCKDDYARTDRYGPCYLCLERGLNCSQDFQALLPGFMWNWTIPGANLSNYKQFVANLQTIDDPLTLPANYTEEIPRIFICPRKKSCANNHNSIEGNCAKGYKGWLCTNCEAGYYSVLTSCVPCPRLAILIAESCVFFFVCALACFLLTWQTKRKAEKGRHARSFVDVIIARIKILLGFYQVIGEIFTSLHDIKWTGPLVIMGKFISAFEINILRLFVRPRCFDEKLDLNPKIQFIIGAISPVVIVLIPFLFYQSKKLYVIIRFSPVIRMSLRSHFQNLETRLFACVVVLLFVIYPPVCSVIFSLYPMACKPFYLNQDQTYNITRLRSDLDVDCTSLQVYHIFAFILTVIYVIAFPAALLYLLCKNLYWLPRKADSLTEDLSHENTDESHDSLIANDSPKYPSPPTWLNFLCENYKKEFWFWEIVELTRKVTQTLLITLFGWEDRLTVIITTCISVLFLLLHARYRPMKSSYEQGLQMFSLTVIFINVIVAANEFPNEEEVPLSVLLVLLNIIVLVIIGGEFLVTIVIHLKGIVGSTRNCITQMVHRSSEDHE
ncbi:uncharacterized protein [Apostichopus japonicus]|uniref:uncharacterized protein isoform X2 n=1 Tax=Stichopus japonicus TaxID=307972 RepID=UPI003AB18F69